MVAGLLAQRRPLEHVDGGRGGDGIDAGRRCGDDDGLGDGWRRRLLRFLLARLRLLLLVVWLLLPGLLLLGLGGRVGSVGRFRIFGLGSGLVGEGARHRNRKDEDDESGQEERGGGPRPRDGALRTSKPGIRMGLWSLSIERILAGAHVPPARTITRTCPAPKRARRASPPGSVTTPGRRRCVRSGGSSTPRERRARRRSGARPRSRGAGR